MEKIYYKIELRMGEWIEENDEVDFKKEIFGELFYYSDGYIIIEDKIITGFLSNDLIMGELTENEIFIEILEDYENGLKYNSFREEFDFIKLPGEYALEYHTEENPELQNCFAIINFITRIKDSAKQKEIEEELKRVKRIYSIP